jgi:phosphotransferase system HPr (HPr) family protein
MAEYYYRVDPRLVHATVTNAWVPELRVERLVVIDDQVVQDRRRMNILSMSAMEEVEVEFTPATKATGTCSREREGDALVLFSSLDGVQAAVRAGLELDELNVGHLPAINGSSAMHPAVFLGPKDLALLQSLHQAGTRVYIQPLPHDPPISPLGIPRPIQVKRPRRRTDPPERVAPAATARAEFQVVNERGLHLRAAHVLAHAASSYEGDVRVGRDGQLVNAKSLLGLTTLGAGKGTRLTVEVVGPRADGMLHRLGELFAGGFQEGSDP